MPKTKLGKTMQSILHGSLIIVAAMLIVMVGFIVGATYFPPEVRVVVPQGAHGVIPENFPAKPPTPPLGVCAAAGGDEVGNTGR